MLLLFDRWLCVVNGLLVAAMLATMLSLVFANIVSRYFFSVSFGWIEEVSRYLMIWIVFIGAGLAMREGMHVAVTIFVDLTTRIKPALTWAAFALVFAFFAALAWYGTEYAQFASRQRSAMLHLPMSMIYLAVPIGSCLAILHLLLSLRDDRTAQP
ncbi:TRAP transporter small permease [Nitratireductor luteus]|uniref:TRAP transporter small permease n=1 Tax=Nitratireductor luteus TaxID=2976980 RepID=UPI00223E9939|nr:TRAP transporter small permease [Nitratireductor luteus]